MRAALYLRVSTRDQTVVNQRRELEAAAAARGWSVTRVYSDEGISGAKGRNGRPQLDQMLQDAARHRFDVVMVWSVDRLGRSQRDLTASMEDLRDAKVALFILQQGLDTTTAAGEAMFGMLGVFSQFERKIIRERILAGIDRAKIHGTKSGKATGRPKIDRKTEEAILERLQAGIGMTRISKELSVGCGTVQRVKREQHRQHASSDARSPTPRGAECLATR